MLAGNGSGSCGPANGQLAPTKRTNNGNNNNHFSLLVSNLPATTAAAPNWLCLGLKVRGLRLEMAAKVGETTYLYVFIVGVI